MECKEPALQKKVFWKLTLEKVPMDTLPTQGAEKSQISATKRRGSYLEFSSENAV